MAVLDYGSFRLWQSYIVVFKTHLWIDLLKEKERLQTVKNNLKNRLSADLKTGLSEGKLRYSGSEKIYTFQWALAENIYHTSTFKP
jgi:hypothetical protein